MPIINPGTGGGSPGPQGPQGIPGINGIPGFDGDSGEDGFPIPGSQGAQGSQGIQGVPGVQGVPGSPGEDGLAGEDFFVPGLQGIQGIQGFKGVDGEDGLSSDDGLWPGFNPFRDDPLEQISRIQDQNNTIFPNYSVVVVGPYTINPGKKLTIGAGGRFKIEQGAPDSPARVFATQTSDFSDTVITEVMAGLGATNSTQIVTPKISGTLLVTHSGNSNVTSGATLGTIIYRVYYGTGTPPAAGSAGPPSLGVQIGNQLNSIEAVGSSSSFSITVLVKGLSIGIAYWFDLSMVASAAAQTVALQRVNFIAVEL